MSPLLKIHAVKSLIIFFSKTIEFDQNFLRVKMS